MIEFVDAYGILYYVLLLSVQSPSCTRSKRYLVVVTPTKQKYFSFVCTQIVYVLYI